MGARSRQQMIDSVQATLSSLIRVSASRSTFARQAAVGGVDLKQPTYVLLRKIIDHGEPISIGDLARSAHMDVGMVSRQVNALVGDGFVVRVPAEGDGRVRLVEPTEEGRAAAAALMDVRARHLQTALSGWSKEDLANLDRLLAAFLDDALSTAFEPRADRTD